MRVSASILKYLNEQLLKLGIHPVSMRVSASILKYEKR